MIPALVWTLAEILVQGTSLIGTEQIDFGHPGERREWRPALNLYCYDLRERDVVVGGGFSWFDVSFVITAWDWTTLGEQRLLSETLAQLVRHRPLGEALLAESLRGHGDLPLTVFSSGTVCPVSLWTALGVPLRPAVLVTVSAPLTLKIGGDQESLPASQEGLMASNLIG